MWHSRNSETSRHIYTSLSLTAAKNTKSPVGDGYLRCKVHHADARENKAELRVQAQEGPKMVSLKMQRTHTFGSTHN